MILPTDSVTWFQQFPRNAIKRQYARNAKSLRQMQARAERTGKKVNGYTADELRAVAERFEGYANAP